MQNRFSATSFLKQYAILLLLLIFCFTYSGCNTGNEQIKRGESEKIKEETGKMDYPDDIKMRPFKNSDSTWGFTIYLNGKIYIHQTVMPGNDAVTGFKSEKDATTVAELVVKKMKNKISPEGVTEYELDSLGIENSIKTSR